MRDILEIATDGNDLLFRQIKTDYMQFEKLDYL